MAEPLTPFEAQALKAKSAVRAEMPDVATVPIEPMGWVDRLISAAKEKIVGGGSVAALAHPAGGVLTARGQDSVAYSPEVLSQMSPSSQADTFAHELKHVQQGREDYGEKGLVGRIMQMVADRKESRLPYGQQPHELEAYQFEGDRAVHQGRTPDPTPKFQLTDEDKRTGQVLREKGEIYLPEPDLDLLPGNNPSVLVENVRKLQALGYSQPDAVKRAQRESRRQR